MTLSSVGQGFVLLRDLWEYNSILKYRYKKRKYYRVAKMKHLPAPLTKEYKPNLAVRVLKAIYNNQKLLWSIIFSHFRDGLQGVGSLISGEPNNDGWIRFEPRTASSIIRNYKEKYPEQYDKLTSTQTMRQQQQLLRQPQGTGGLQGLNQEVRERKLTHVRYTGDDEHHALTKGKVYKIESYSTFNDGSEYIKIIGNEPPSSIRPHWCFSLYQKDGVPNDIKKFELIYDNYENN